MSRFITADVEVECEDEHCDEFTAATCPNRAVNKKGQGGRNPLERELDRLWRLHGPDDERFCDVTLTSVEPWRSLADAIYGIDAIPEVSLFLRAGVKVA